MDYAEMLGQRPFAGMGPVNPYSFLLADLFRQIGDFARNPTPRYPLPGMNQAREGPGGAVRPLRGRQPEPSQRALPGGRLFGGGY